MRNERNLGCLEHLLVDDNGLVLVLLTTLDGLGASQDSRGNQGQSGDQRGGNFHRGMGMERGGEKEGAGCEAWRMEYQGEDATGVQRVHFYVRQLGSSLRRSLRIEFQRAQRWKHG